MVDPLKVGDLSPFWDVGDRPVDRGRDARGGRGPADLPDPDRRRPPPGLRRPDRRRPGRVRLSALARQPGPPGARGLAPRAARPGPTGGVGRSPRPSSATPWTTSATSSTSPTSSAASSTRLGRVDWAEAEFAAFLDAIEHRAEEDRWRRLSGLHMLNRRGLEVARRLSEWRVEDARRANRPLRSVLRDDLLVAIAKRQPASRRDLEALRDFNRPAPPEPGRRDPRRDRRGPGRARRGPPRARRAARRRPGPGDGRQPALGHALAVLRPGAGSPSAWSAASSDLKDLVRWYLDGQARGRTARPAPGLAARGLRPDPARRPLRPPGASGSSTPRPRSPSPSTPWPTDREPRPDPDDASRARGRHALGS